MMQPGVIVGLVAAAAVGASAPADDARRRLDRADAHRGAHPDAALEVHRGDVRVELDGRRLVARREGRVVARKRLGPGAYLGLLVEIIVEPRSFSDAPASGALRLGGRVYPFDLMLDETGALAPLAKLLRETAL